MGENTVRSVLERRLDSPVEVGSYRGVDGVWAKVKLDPRVEYSMRPTSLSCDGRHVTEMKVRFLASSAPAETVLATLADLESLTAEDGEVSAENHELSADDEVWPHIQYEDLDIAAAASVIATLESEPLPTYRDDRAVSR